MHNLVIQVNNEDLRLLKVKLLKSFLSCNFTFTSFAYIILFMTYLFFRYFCLKVHNLLILLNFISGKETLKTYQIKFIQVSVASVNHKMTTNEVVSCTVDW